MQNTVNGKLAVKFWLNNKDNKFSTFCEAEPYTVIAVNGTSIKARRDSDGRIVFRNSSHYKLWKPAESTSHADTEEEEDDTTQPCGPSGCKPGTLPSTALMDNRPNNSQTQPTQESAADRRYPVCDRKQNTRWTDYYVYRTVR